MQVSGPLGHGFRYAPGLDGVRALAVFAVLAYHIGTTSASTVLPGGFLGVDVFFVLSGYLITSLLVVEVHSRADLDQEVLYPAGPTPASALFAMLLVVAAIGAFWLPQQAARLTGDLLASLGYVTNWWLIAENSSYFATAGDRPPMLTHLWSLAVEEQYYLVWPLILIVFAAVRARRGSCSRSSRRDHRLDGGGYRSTTRSRTRPASTTARHPGARAAARRLPGDRGQAVAPPRPTAARHPARTRPARHHSAAGPGSVAAMLRDTDDVLYLGGFLVIAVLGGVVVGVAGHPGTALGETLGTQPLRWLGERSYAIYLWHWPVCLLTRPGVDVPLTGWANAGLRIGISILLAEISYRLIEKPIRKHGFLAPLRRTKTPTARTRPAAGPDEPSGRTGVGRAGVGRAGSSRAGVSRAGIGCHAIGQSHPPPR